MLAGGDLLFEAYDVLYLIKEPAVYLSKLADCFDRYAGSYGFLDPEYAVPLGDADSFQEFVRLKAGGGNKGKAGCIILQTLAGLLQCFRECPSNGHYLTHTLHLEAKGIIRSLKLIEVPARHLYDYVIE